MNPGPASVTHIPQAGGRLAALAALLVAVLALVSAGAALAQPGPPGMPGHPGGMPGMHQGGMPGMHPGGMPGMHPRGMDMMGHGRLLDAVGANAEQKAKIHDIFKAAHDDLRGQRQAGRPLREEMGKLMAAPTLDNAAVEALRQKIEAQHDARSKRMTRAMVEASAVLTPEQRQKLAERIGQQRSMMERHQRERQSLDPAAPR